MNTQSQSQAGYKTAPRLPTTIGTSNSGGRPRWLDPRPTNQRLPTNPEELQVLTSGGREEDVRLGRQGVAGNGGEAMECGGKSTAFIGERARGVRARLTQAGPAYLARPRIL